MIGPILHVAQPTVAGVARCIADLATDQTARGWEVVVAAPSDGTLRQEVSYAGARYEVWEATSSPSIATLAECRRLQQIIDDVDPALVHLHSSKAGLVGRLIMRGRRPTIFQPHSWSFFAATGSVRKATLAWERTAARWVDRVVCVSEGEQRFGETSGIDTTYELVRNGVDLEWFRFADDADRSRARLDLGLPEVPTVVSVGRLHRQKAQDRLLNIWSRVTEQVPDAHLILVGDGPLRAEFERSAPSGVTFAGAIDDVRPWLAACDLVAMPSRWEGLSLALLEAMATGRPVVASEVSGMREALLNGDLPAAGAVVADDAELLDAILERLAHPELARSEGVAARRRAEAHFALAQTLDRMAEVTRSVVELQPIGIETNY